ncbi:MAG: ankyrin repeat domain-containing protein [Dehalobacter sp.]|nr:ankyrin repeat domain-containing protein [Dehalobacter sp.]
MGFISLILGAILGFVSIFGIILSLIGLILLIIYLAKRKTKKKKGLLIAAIVLLLIGIPTAFTFPGFYTIANNASMNQYVNPKEYPVNNAVMKHDNNKLKKLLDEGANPNEIFKGVPAIFWACSNFDDGVNYEAAKILISHKVNLSYDDCSLMKDILIGEKRYDDQSDIYNIVKLLIENGYNVNETDSDGITLLMYATVDSKFDKGFTLSNKLTDLLLKSGAKINERDNKGRTVLMWACGSVLNSNADISKIPSIELKDQFASFDYNIIKSLIKTGVDVNSKDNQGFTALDYFKQTEEIDKKWGQYDTVGQTKDYIDECKAIEILLQGE